MKMEVSRSYRVIFRCASISWVHCGRMKFRPAGPYKFQVGDFDALEDCFNKF